MSDVIDTEGFRQGIGIILTNQLKQVLWAKRINQDAWQFPQGGIQQNESPQQAMIRELFEEIGLKSEDVEILHYTKNWYSYTLPKKLLRIHQKPQCIGQKQIWYLLKLRTSENEINLVSTSSPEFDSWRWVAYRYPIKQVISFKKKMLSTSIR